MRRIPNATALSVLFGVMASGCGGEAPSLLDTATEDTPTDSAADTQTGEPTANDSDPPDTDELTATQPATNGTQDEPSDVDTATSATDGPCPYACGNWQACLDAGGEIESAYTCVDPLDVCCHGGPVETGSASHSGPDTTVDTSTDSKPACDPEYVCAITGTCKLLGGIPHDEMSCAGQGGGVCCEYPDSTDSTPAGEWDCATLPAQCADIGASSDEQYAGCCWGNVAYWCEIGIFQQEDCGTLETCSWDIFDDYVSCN